VFKQKSFEEAKVQVGSIIGGEPACTPDSFHRVSPACGFTQK